MKKFKIIVCLCLILGAVATAFFPCLKNGFTNWDDAEYITENPVIRSLSLRNIKTIFSSVIFANYHPITVLSFMIEYRLFKFNPYYYHLNNLQLHLFNCLLVFWLVFILCGRASVALLTALLFGVHPLQVESVAWISERKGLLCGLFFIGAIISYLYYLRKERRSVYYYFSILLFIFSLLCKPVALSLPLVLLLVDYSYRRKKIAIRDKIPFFIVSSFFGIVAVYAQYAGEAIRPEGVFNIVDKLTVAIYALMFYLAKILMPLKLACVYPFSAMKDPHLFIYSFTLLLGVTAVFIKSKEQRRKIIFGSGFFFIAILPALQFVPIGQVRVADRYVYLPLLGIAYIASEGCVWLYQRAQKRVMVRISLLIIPAVVIATLSFLSWRRCQIWHNNVTLWNDVLHNYPEVYTAYLNRGNDYLGKGGLDAAIADYSKTLEINPRAARAYSNRATVYLKKGDLEQALSDCNKALEINPRKADAYSNRGVVYQRKGDFEQALSDYSKALAIDPRAAVAYGNRATVYIKKGDFEQALRDLNKALEINPYNAQAYNNRGNIYQNKGDLSRAIADYSKTLEIDPNYANAYNNRGNIYQNKGDLDRAIAEYDKASGIDSHKSESYYNRGVAYQKKGNLEHAITDYNKAIEIDSRCAKAYNNRAVIYFKKREYSRSWEDIRKAQMLGYEVNIEFIEEVKKALGSGRN